MSKSKHLLLAFLPVIVYSNNANATPVTDLPLGHFEMQIDYALSPGTPDAGWQFSVSYNTSGDFSTPNGTIRLDTDDTTIVALPETELALPASVSIPGFATSGDTIWLLPQSNNPGQIFLGLRTIIPAGIFQSSINGNYFPNPQGNIIIELIGLSGTGADAGGHFAMWETNGIGTVEMHFNSTDGFDANDKLEPVPIGAHSHYNWAFTEPGNYAATFRASARINPGQPDAFQDTQGTFDLNFSVPFSSIADGAAELRLAMDAVPAPASIKPLNETVEYAPGHAVMTTQAVEIGGALRPYAFQIIPVVDTALPEAHRVGISGIEPIAYPAGTIAAADEIEILGVYGPGSLQQLTEGGNRYFAFSNSGIYRVQLRAVGMQQGSNVYGPPFELVFLAGLDADYDFAAWADSYERTHGLNSGSLQDDGSDWDKDGVPDVIEYQLFWEGLDPAVADAAKLPRPDPSDPDRIIIFHRDTFKDRLNRNTQNIVLEHSEDLSSWLGWSDRVPGEPLEQLETGDELGNAYGRIHRRSLRLPADDVPQNSFFRWRIDPAQ